MRYDSGYRETRTLEDGTSVTLRCIRPEDREGLMRAFAKLSRASRYRRFLADMPFLSESMARYLTEVDGRDHVAILATTDSLDLKSDEGIGVARFLRLPEEPHVAEAAVTVLDAYQGRGLGKILLEVLALAARERGIRTFRGTVLASNTPMRKILDEVGGVVRPVDEETVTVDVSIEEPRHRWSELPLFRMLRAAASVTRAALLGEDASDDAERG